MKHVLLASVLGSVVGAAAIGGPFHLQVTKTHSLFGMLNGTVSGGNTVLSLGQLPWDYVITDVVVDGQWPEVYVAVNGTNVAALRVNVSGSFFVEPMHLHSGIYVPAGATISVLGVGGSIQSKGVTVSGYGQ